MVTTAPRTASAGPVLGSPAVTEGRQVLRRKGLPSGRAVTGALLVAVAAVGVFAAYQNANRGPSTAYVVVVHDVPLGGRLTPADVGLRKLDLPPSLAGRAFTSPDAVIGTVTLAPLASGELVQRSTVVPDEADGAFEVPLPLPAEELPVTLVNGDRVNVLATYSDAGGYTVEAVLDAVIVDVGGGTSGGITSSGKRTITLGLRSREDVLAVTHALRAGQITLVRGTLAAESDPPAGTYVAPGAANGTPAGATTSTTPTTRPGG